MATLDPSNVINGNTIEASDIAQLYQAFGTGSGADITGLSMTGSLYGNALTATTATTATTASNITTAVTGGGTHYLTFVNGDGTKPAKIASLLEYNAGNNNLQVTASQAVTSSYADNASVTQINDQSYTVISSGPIDSPLRFAAGLIKCSSNIGQTPPNPALIDKTLGTDAWVTLTIEATSPSSGNIATIKALDPLNGVIDIVTAGGSGAENVHYHVIYVP
jgi:hypothetical protein